MSAVESLAAALVDANDQLLALYELATLSTNSLDRDRCLDPILERAGRILGTSSLRFDERFDEAESPTRDGQVSISVTSADGRRGMVVAQRDTPFGTADNKLLRAVGHIALGAVRTAEMHADAVAQALLTKEHEAASELARMALPTRRPSLDGLDVFARSDPARLAGGDLFTFVEDGSMLSFVVGDVSGKGLPAAMVMTTIISSAAAALAVHGNDPVGAIQAIDASVQEYLSDSGLFCTIMAGSIDATTGELRIANAGHSPVLIIRCEDNQSTGKPVPATAPPIGVIPIGDTTLSTFTTTLALGDRIAACSDGLTEQLGVDGEMFGDARLIEALHGRAANVAELGRSLFSALDSFADGVTATDDRTLLLVERTNPVAHSARVFA